MNRMMKAVLIITLIAAALLFLLLSAGRLTDVRLDDFSTSEEGKMLALDVVSEGDFVRAMTMRQEGSALHLTFFSTYGINSSMGAQRRFLIAMPPACSELYIERGADRYDLLLKRKDGASAWERPD